MIAATAITMDEESSMRQSGRGRGERIGEAMDEEEVSTIKIGGGGGKHDPHLCLYML